MTLNDYTGQELGIVLRALILVINALKLIIEQREKNPALNGAWDQYRLLKRLVE